jgi:hypothetical protein
MSDTPLNAQQIQQIQNAAERRIAEYIRDTQLRKWAIEQAITRFPGQDDLITRASQIFDFVAQPFNLDIKP